MVTFRHLCLAPVSFGIVLLSGCGLTSPTAGSLSADGPLQGRVHGGQQPVSGAAISLYAAGSSGNGRGAIQLLNTPVFTDQYGGFNLAGTFTCPSASTQVYLVARGGNPGLGTATSNPALVLASLIGDCGAITPATFISVNEVSTAAAAWTLAQFMAPAAIVGASPTNATGLRNAFLAAQNLVNTSTGSAPGNLPVGAGFELAKLNTLANALAPCVNSDGTTGCAPLFSAAGLQTGAQTNTLDAALSIVQHPGANIAAVFNAAGPQPIFQPSLTSAPHDWTLSITYGQCNPASLCGGLSDPSTLAVDSTGAVWVANYTSPAVSKFSSSGIPASLAGFPGQGLRQSYGLAVDVQDSAWVTNQQSVSAANNNRNGSVSHFTNAGAETSGPGITAGGIYYPQAAAADPAGNIWIANYGNSSATLLSPTGSALSPSGYAASALPFVTSVAIDSGRNAWFGAQKLIGQVTPLGVTTTYSCCQYPAGVAIDSTGNIWLADYRAFAVVQVSPTGSTLSTTVLDGANNAPQALAIDGIGNIWTANYFGNSVSQLASGSGAVRSPSLGFGQDAPLDEPYSIAIDASGNLWLSNANSSTLTEFFGLAAPVRTPSQGPPVAP